MHCVSSRNDLKKLLSAAQEQGWRIELGKGGHFKLYAPDGVGRVTMSSTPSDRRALNNAIAQMRRFGFEWKGR
jgi:predicted RNA binding protein YcfA (HicA-like mRNA interferase family)